MALARAGGTIPKPSALPGGCLYEPKWDGFRLVIFRDAAGTSLWSRQGKDLTRYFPDLAEAAEEQIPPGCVVDGEAISWTDGRLDFSSLQERLAAGPKTLPRRVREHAAAYAAFDLLAVAGQDIRGMPFHDRRTLLEELADGWAPPLDLSPATSDLGEARAWFEEMAAAGVEGLVVKGRNQAYEGGQRQWLKVKHRDTLDVVCGAVTGPIEKPKDIVAGFWIEGELRIAGRSAPLKPAAARSLGKLLTPCEGEHPWPAELPPDRFGNSKGATPLTHVVPMVVEVSADAAWSGRSFRHPLRYLRARPELDPEEVQLPR